MIKHVQSFKKTIWVNFRLHPNYEVLITTTGSSNYTFRKSHTDTKHTDIFRSVMIISMWILVQVINNTMTSHPDCDTFEISSHCFIFHITFWRNLYVCLFLTSVILQVAVYIKYHISKVNRTMWEWLFKLKWQSSKVLFYFFLWYLMIKTEIWKFHGW